MWQEKEEEKEKEEKQGRGAGRQYNGESFFFGICYISNALQL